MSTLIPKADFTKFEGSAFQKIKNLKLQAFPLRVINVKGTTECSRATGGVIFSAVNSWEFHIVSHRWTCDIEDLSKDVAQVMERRQSRISYEEALKYAGLQRNKGYKGLIQFLEVLQEDGVDLVWLDTLCINQLDKKEKEREILRMGEFYSLTLGCYVSLHGLGSGFKAVADDGQPPVWFSRAWTLQEFILPQNLTFIVEMDQSQLKSVVNFVKKIHVEKTCACKGSNGWSWGSTSGPYEQEQRSAQEDEANFWKALQQSDYKCTRGRLARTSCENLYFMDRNAYIPLAFIISGESSDIFDFGTRLGLTCHGGTVGLVKEIADRDCKLEEDRALCMLGLLGVTGEDGVQRIEVGRTLNQQLVELTRGMVSCNLDDLIKMLVAVAGPKLINSTEERSPEPTWTPIFRNSLKVLRYIVQVMLEAVTKLINSTEERSPEPTWMPIFRKSLPRNEVLRHIVQGDTIEGLSNMVDFKSMVESVSVGVDGSLTLTCGFISARLLPLEEHRGSCTHVTNRINGKGCCSCCNSNPKHDNCFRAASDEVWVLDMKDQGHALPFHSSQELGDEFQGRAFWPHLLACGKNNYVYPSHYLRGWLLVPNQDFANGCTSNVSLLLLGTSLETRYLNNSPVVEKVLLFMICLGDSHNKLRKIGHLRALPQYREMKASGKIDYDHLPKVQSTVR
ncbi:uncharacterized protein LOC9635605 [Selaginella moellendorffii]|nr:uncharacterized protein LOC9635605 [Selaginella moellendorffii]XP_024542982.1 uncharacterized protein LOC9635605 [Selaginella moellendorffii]|eukprot:XP_024542981.1 uncharacterized protein LOC9635605 [Selaginella moellendorffii]